MRICIVGTGDAGSTAAIQIRRLNKDAQIEMFTGRAKLGCPPCEMPLVISGTVPGWDELVRGFRLPSFWEKRDVGLHLDTEVTDISRKDRRLVAGGTEYQYDKLILALGATAVVPAFPGLNGEGEFALGTDMADGVALEDAVARSSEAAVVGGGFIALEIAAGVKERGYARVQVLLRRGIMRSYLDDEIADRVKDVLTQHGVELILPAQIESVAGAGGRKRLVLSDREVEADFVFFATGAEPNASLARKAGLAVGDTGAIAVNERLQTSDPDIYAIGDCMENWDVVTASKRRHQLAANAIRTGYVAGRNAVLGDRLSYHGTVMPFVTKLFDHQVGAVGLTEREAGERGLSTASVVVETARLRDRFDGRPAYYKLVADAASKTLIGAQVISQEIVSGTVDKLAVAIANHMPLAKLVQIDSCYSPSVQEDQIAVPLHRLIDKLG